MKTIKEIREMTGLSQRQFAECYHIKLRNIQNWEQGSRRAPESVCYLLECLIEKEMAEKGAIGT